MIPSVIKTGMISQKCEISPGGGTKVALGRLLWAAGLRGGQKRWKVLEKPDFTWQGRKIAVFVNG